MTDALAASVPVAIIGAGTMGTGIAQLACLAGHRTILIGTPPETLDAARRAIAGGLETLVGKGRLTAAARDAALGRLETSGELAAAAPAGLAIEAVPEDMALKHRILLALEATMAPDAILASNTSALSLAAMARPLARPQRFCGLHFFNPAQILPLVEVIDAPLTAPAICDIGVATMRAWGKSPIRCRSTPGFVVNRCARAYYAEALRALAERAADPATIDAVMRESGGFRMGPCELMDMIGHDINAAATASLFAATFGDPRYRGSPIQTEMVEAGLLGRKTGRGFYDHAKGAPKPLPATAAPGPRPRRMRVLGELGPAAALAARAIAAGLDVDCAPGDGRIVVDGIHLALGDGRPASLRSDVDAVFDLALDAATQTRAAIAVSDRALAGAGDIAAGFFQALGIAVSVVDDMPGLLVLRSVACLANEALDAAQQGVASEDDIDLAMTKGVNYPLGPIAWAGRIGFARVLRTLENLEAVTGDDRYRPCLRLRRRAAAPAS
ncbi:MAG: 3-hydroxyacyl-CoA dehydrogenase [Rhodospirillales bacterium]